MWLFSEVEGQNCGVRPVIKAGDDPTAATYQTNSSMSSGMMAGLADLRLARAVTLMHDQPAKAWSVAELAVFYAPALLLSFIK